ncbi:hypothetical protein JOM56_004564 [Amanita muscaria]
MIPVNEAEVIATFVQAVLYGLYIATLAHCLRWVMYDDEGWKLRNVINWYLVGLTMLVFALSTSDLGILLQITIDGVVDGSPTAMERLNDAIVALEQVTFLIVDALMIYRCWEIYGKNWRLICVPCVFWFASIVLTIVDIVLRATRLSKMTENDVFDPSKFSWIWAAFICLTIVITIYCSWFILHHFIRTSSVTKHKLVWLHRTCLLISEAGLVYTATGPLNLIASVIARPGHGDVLIGLICNAVHFSAAGIAFNLILIRVYQERAYPKLTDKAGTGPVEKRKDLSALQFRANTITTTHATRSLAPTSSTESESEQGMVFAPKDTKISFAANVTQ